MVFTKRKTFLKFSIVVFGIFMGCNSDNTRSFQKSPDAANQSQDQIIIEVDSIVNRTKNPVNNKEIQKSFDRHLLSLISDINTALKNLVHWKSNNNNLRNDPLQNNYNGLLKELHETLKLLNENNTDYDFKNDTKLTELAQYLELDTVITIFKKYNIKFSTDSVQRSPTWVSRDFEHTLALTYVLTQSGKIKDTSIEILPPSVNSHEENRKIGTVSYYAQNQSFVDYKEFILGKLYKYNGSTATTMISIWNAEKEMMKLDYVLGSISEDYGTPKIDTLLLLNNGKKLFIGQQLGGDAGNVWGSFWIREWTNANMLKVLIERKIGGGESSRTKITHSFLNDSTIELINSVKYEQNKVYLDSIISIETLNLLEL